MSSVEDVENMSSMSTEESSVTAAPELFSGSFSGPLSGPFSGSFSCENSGL